MGIMDRLRGGLFSLFGGPDDPRLSAGQNADANRQAVLQAGLQSIMAADQPGLKPLATAIAGGQQAGRAARQQTMTKENAARMAEVFKSGEMDFRQLERAFGQAIASGDYETARALSPVMSAAVSASSRQPKSLQSVSVVHPRTGQPVETSFDPGTGEYYFEDPETGETFSTRSAQSAPRQPLVSMENRQEGALNQAFGQGVGTSLAESVQAGLTARGDLARYEELASLLEQPGVYQGTAGEAVQRAKEIGTALGIPGIEGVPAGQAIQSIGSQFALRFRNPESGFGMPGALSNMELQFLRRMVPSLAQTPEGNKLLIQAMRRMAQRQIDISRSIQRYAGQNGGSMDLGVYQFVENQFKDANMFEDLTVPNPFVPPR